MGASAKPQFEALTNVVSTLAGDYEQAPYTTLKDFDGYEMRQYQSVNWVCTEATYEMDKEPEMFMKLFRYISGVNKEQKEVEMTVPVLSRIKLLVGRIVNKQMCFYSTRSTRPTPQPPSREDRAEQGVYCVCAHLRRLCQERLNERGKEVCRSAEESRRGGGHLSLLHGQLRQPYEVLEQAE